MKKMNRRDRRDQFYPEDKLLSLSIAESDTEESMILKV